MSHTIFHHHRQLQRRPLLRGCVDSQLACPLDVEIVVVDNASSDGSLDGLPESSHIRIIRNPAYVGFAAACNIRVQAATAPFLLFLNPDCYFQPGTVAALLGRLQYGDRVGMVGGLLVNEDGTGIWCSSTPMRPAILGFHRSHFGLRRRMWHGEWAEALVRDYPIDKAASFRRRPESSGSRIPPQAEQQHHGFDRFAGCFFMALSSLFRQCARLSSPALHG